MGATSRSRDRIHLASMFLLLQGRILHGGEGRDHRQRQHRDRSDDQDRCGPRARSNWRALVGIDPRSDGLALAQRLGVPATSDGIDGLLKMPGFGEIAVVFDATSAGAHARHDAVLRSHAKQIVDLTPAAHRAVPRSRRQFPRAGRSAERQPGHLRRAGDDSDRRGDHAHRARALCRDRRQHREQVGWSRHARQHRRVHADDRARARACRRRRPRARRSSS